MCQRRPSEVPEQQAALGGARDHDVSLVQRQAQAGEDALSAENAHGPGLHVLGFTMACFRLGGRGREGGEDEERGTKVNACTAFLILFASFVHVCAQKVPWLVFRSALARVTKSLKRRRGTQRRVWVKGADKEPHHGGGSTICPLRDRSWGLARRRVPSLKRTYTLSGQTWTLISVKHERPKHDAPLALRASLPPPLHEASPVPGL